MTRRSKRSQESPEANKKPPRHARPASRLKWLLLVICIFSLSIVLMREFLGTSEKPDSSTRKGLRSTATKEKKTGLPIERSDRSVLVDYPATELSPDIGTPQRETLSFKWTVGQKLVYSFQHAQKLSIKPIPHTEQDAGTDVTPNFEPCDIDTDAQGLLSVRIYESTEDRIVGGYSFSNLSLSTLVNKESAPSEQLARQLETEALVNLTRRGRIVQTRFPLNTSPEVINLLKAWLAVTQLVLPEEPKNHWQETEDDSMGVFVADYTLVEHQTTTALISKRKKYGTPYLASPPGEDGIDPALLQISSGGEISYQLDAEKGILAEVRGNELVTVKGKDDALPMEVHSVIIAQFRLLSYSLEIEEVRARYEQLKAAGSMAAFDGFRPLLSAEMIGATEASWLGDASFDDLLSEIVRASMEDRWLSESPRIFMFLTELFKRSEDETTKALRVLRLGSYNAEVCSTILDALGACGRDSAMKGLVEIVFDERLAIEIRVHAVRAMSAIPNPIPECVSCLMGYAGSSHDVDFMYWSINSLGVMAARLEDSERGREIVTFLKGHLGRSSETDCMVLEALGNAGAPQSLEAIKPYLQNPDERTRAIATSALRKMSSSEAGTLVIDRLSNDPSPFVRCEAIGALRGRTSAEIRGHIEKALFNDQEESVRAEAVRYFTELMESGKCPSARQTIEEVAAKDPSQGLRTMARQALGQE